MSNGPSIATLAIPAIISASAALAGVALNAGLSRRAQRLRQREERYGEAIRLARRIVYLLLTTPAPGSEDSLRRQKEIVEAESEYTVVTGTSLRVTSAEFIKACRIFAEAMVDESTTPRIQELQRLTLGLPLRLQDERIASTQAMYEALVRMVDVADRDLASSRRRWILRRR